MSESLEIKDQAREWEKIARRLEIENEIYRQMAIEMHHYEHPNKSWEENSEAVDREVLERMQRQHGISV